MDNCFGDYQQKLGVTIVFLKMIVIYLKEMHYGFSIVQRGLQMVIGYRENIHQS